MVFAERDLLGEGDGLESEVSSNVSGDLLDNDDRLARYFDSHEHLRQVSQGYLSPKGPNIYGMRMPYFAIED